MLDSVQKEYVNELQIVLVNSSNTGDTKEKISRLMSRMNIKLPVVLKDSITWKIFEHKLLPHYVWVDRDMNVIGITSGEEVTRDNIRKVINRQPVSLTLKSDIEFNRHKPLFIDDNGGDGSGLEFRSTLSNRINGLPSGSYIRRNKSGMVTGMIVTNTSRYYLLRQAYQSDIPLNRTKILVDSASLFSGTYCYELITPPCTLQDAFIYMQQDLERYFRLAIKTESRVTECYVLKADTTFLNKYKSKGGKPENKIFDPYGRYMTNQRFKMLGSYLDRVLDKPVSDESNITFNVDLKLDIKEMNIQTLRKPLVPYGITLTDSKRAMDNLIIYQKQQP